MVFQVHLEKPQGRSIVWKELPESESGLELKISEPFLMIMSNTVAGDQWTKNGLERSQDWSDEVQSFWMTQQPILYASYLINA